MTRLQLDRLLEQTVADALGVKLERSHARRAPRRQHAGIAKPGQQVASKHVAERRHLEHA